MKDTDLIKNKSIVDELVAAALIALIVFLFNLGEKDDISLFQFLTSKTELSKINSDQVHVVCIDDEAIKNFNYESEEFYAYIKILIEQIASFEPKVIALDVFIPHNVNPSRQVVEKVQDSIESYFDVEDPIYYWQREQNLDYQMVCVNKIYNNWSDIEIVKPDLNYLRNDIHDVYFYYGHDLIQVHNDIPTKFNLNLTSNYNRAMNSLAFQTYEVYTGIDSCDLCFKDYLVNYSDEFLSGIGSNNIGFNVFDPNMYDIYKKRFYKKIVLVGAVFESMDDWFSSPQKYPIAGVEVHSHIIKQLLSNHMYYQWREPFFVLSIVIFITLVVLFRLGRNDLIKLVIIVFIYIAVFVFILLVFNVLIPLMNPIKVMLYAFIINKFADLVNIRKMIKG